MRQMICDLCGKFMDPEANDDLYHVEVKCYGREHLRYAFWTAFWERKATEKVDVCGECMKRIVSRVTETTS